MASKERDFVVDVMNGRKHDQKCLNNPFPRPIVKNVFVRTKFVGHSRNYTSLELVYWCYTITKNATKKTVSPKNNNNKGT